MLCSTLKQRIYGVFVLRKCPPETTKRRPLTRTQMFDNKITNETKVSLFYTNRGYLSFSRANEKNFQSNLEEYVVVDQKFCNFALYMLSTSIRNGAGKIKD